MKTHRQGAKVRPVGCAILTCTFLVFATELWARIGESDTEITARYGQSIGDIQTQAFGPISGFALPGFVVGVKIQKGTSVMEMVTKSDQSGMAPAEIDALLKKHGADALWKLEPSDSADWKHWRTEDGALVAVYDTKRHFLYVNTRQFYNAGGNRVEQAGSKKQTSGPEDSH